MVLDRTSKGITNFDTKQVGNPQPSGGAPSTLTHTHTHTLIQRSCNRALADLSGGCEIPLNLELLLRARALGSSAAPPRSSTTPRTWNGLGHCHTDQASLACFPSDFSPLGTIPGGGHCLTPPRRASQKSLQAGHCCSVRAAEAHPQAATDRLRSPLRLYTTRRAGGAAPPRTPLPPGGCAPPGT